MNKIIVALGVAGAIASYQLALESQNAMALLWMLLVGLNVANAVYGSIKMAKDVK